MAGPSYTPGPGFGAFINQLANPPNPMEQLDKTVNALTAVKNFQANQAMANIYSQAIDPVTGQVDQGKLNALIGANPAAAWNAGPAMQQAGQAVGAEGIGTSANVKANLDQLSAAGTLMLPLYKQAIATNYVSPADAQAALDQAYQMKLVTPQQYQAYSSTLKGTQNAAGFVIGANAGIESARTLAIGRPSLTDVGPGFVPTQTVPGALPSAAPPLQKGTTPGENINISKWLSDQSVAWPDKNDPTKMHYGTNADRIKDLYGQAGLDAIEKGWAGGGYGPNASAPSAPAAPAASVPPPNAGSTPGAGNWEVQHNNFAGMRNPNVPAAGGPNTNPSGWQQFPTPEAGVQAISNQIDRYVSGATTGKPLNTIRGIVSTWAPASDGNPTPALIARASSIVGVGPDQPLNWDDPGVKSRLVEAMIRNEQGGALPQAAAAAIPKVFAGGAAPAPAAVAAPGGAAPTLVPGGGAQLQPTPVSFPTGTVGTAPITLPKTTEASADQFNAARQAATQFESRTSGLSQSLNELRANVNLNTGPGEQDLQNLSGIARAWAIDLSQATKDNNTAWSVINKDLERYYMSLPGANRSDLAQTEQKMANPSAQAQQREALDDLITRTIGLERMNNAAYKNFVQQHGAQASMYAPQYADESAQYMQGLDPVGFAFNLQTPQQRLAYRNSLQTDDQKAAYYRSIKEASRLYNLQIPRQ